MDADILFFENLDYIFDTIKVNCNFKGWIREKENSLDGCFFLITNTLNIKDFKNNLNYYKKNISDDEEFLNLYFKNKLTSDISLNSNFLFLHFTGGIKLFNLTNQIKAINYIFNLLNEQQFNSFILNNKNLFIALIKNLAELYSNIEILNINFNNFLKDNNYINEI